MIYRFYELDDIEERYVTKLIPLGDLFTSDDMDKAASILAQTKDQTRRVARLEREVVIPRMDHIDFVTRQENHPPYFAWLILHTLTQHRE